jgi:1,4-alpha-glucan branching enzyme
MGPFGASDTTMGIHAMIDVRFVYMTGQRRRAFRNARLAGSWNSWADIPMAEIVAEDGCPAFAATVSFDDGQAGQRVWWGVRLDGPAGANAWGIMTDDQQRQQELQLPGPGASAEAHYYLTWSRRLGAQKHYPGGSAAPDLRFAVWAPNALNVDVLFATAAGYIADDEDGKDRNRPAVPLRQTAGGIFKSDPVVDFAANVGAPYMFRIKNGQGQTTYRTDIYSRWQIGRGSVDPSTAAWDHDPATLDGRVGCSVVIDQDVVREEFEPTSSPAVTIGDDLFWRDEFTPGLPVPNRVQDLVIYELHIGALGFERPDTGTLADAMRLLDQLVELGVNAVELMPLAEFSGNLGWGYGNTHHFAIESSAGGRDKYKHFVRACHQRGIAVLVDVVYNHFDNKAARAEWDYDSTQPEQNIYYWYEGTSPKGGYLNNGSSGYAPRYWEEPVRQLFISSAVELLEEFHVDGLRVDLTEAIHRDNTVDIENGWGVSSANVFGQKLLREWSRTLRMFKPSIMLIAEDHSEWPKVTEDPRTDGLGFDSTWFAAFYHHLIGDSKMAGGKARLLRQAGFGNDGPLAIQQFAGALWQTQFDKIAYHESHDEAGNSGTARTSMVAVNHASLVGATRDFAEARCRIACGLSMLSAGTPMFFMGEEIVAQRSYRFDNVSQSKEDLAGERAGAGARMFRFYQDLIRMRRVNRALRSRQIDIVHASDSNRIIAFTRREGQTEVLVVASLNNQPFQNGYRIQTDPNRLPTGLWRETFNSDSDIYGGANVGNLGAAIPADNGHIELVIPANALLVLQRS